MSGENDQKKPDLNVPGTPTVPDTAPQTAGGGAPEPPAVVTTVAASADDRQILYDLERLFVRYVAVEPRLPLVLALWTVATYCFHLFDAFPYLAISSPTKRCGKTRLLDLLRMVCKGARATVGITAAALFRTIEEEHPTLLIDEAESLASKTEKAESLREILNAGYRKGQKVVRCQGPNHERKEFDVYCPKALALIGELPDTLADRCIPIRMRRRGLNEKIDRLRFANLVSETTPLRERLKNWVTAHASEIKRWYSENDLLCLEDREAELWTPLFAVCSQLSPHRLADLEAVACELSQSKTIGEPTDLGIRLLADIRDAFTRRGVDKIATGALISDVSDWDESPWRHWNRGSGMNSRDLSRLLKPFGISPQNLRFDEKVVKGYSRQSFEDAWARYLPAGDDSASRYTATEPVNTGENTNPQSATARDCSAAGNAQTANENGPCSAVADDPDPPPADEEDINALIAWLNRRRNREPDGATGA